MKPIVLGVDFDNTIACYDALFHRLAVEDGLIPPNVSAKKTAVRDHLRATGREGNWTHLQGLAYGPSIDEAEPFSDAVHTLTQLAARGVEIHIVSHKTRHPVRGEPHDLHAAARRFLDQHGISPAIVPAARVHLCPTKHAKLETIAALRCTHFLDDLPEFLAEPRFPDYTQPILFDPHAKASGNAPPNAARITGWAQLPEHLKHLS